MVFNAVYPVPNFDQALLLAQHLAELGSAFLSGARVIELGAGTGLVGMVACAVGKL